MSEPDAPTRRRRLPAAEAKARILEAAGIRLREGGPDAIRLQDVAADLGIAHTTILHHFGTREGLMLALERDTMEKLQADLLTGDADEDPLELVDRVLGDQGHARLLAWMALTGRPLGFGETDERMLETLANAIHADRVEAGDVDADPEDSVFAVRLVAAAMIGEGLMGRIFSASAGLADDPDVGRRFRVWLGRLLERS